ncbi:MAG TPA: hypothetical protein VJU82_02975 [Acidobacteriaceae bacterium]|nr:hypothetical protein [Acidobacteriaceae bacterium]
MATTTQISAPPRTASPLALWHLLSLDAPTVATLWTVFVARATHTALPTAAPAAMFLAVWILYAADRLLDTRHLDSRDHTRATELEARHLFHFRHRRTFLAFIPVAAIGVAALLPSFLTATLHLYFIEGSVLIGWFLLVHTTHSELPKELVVGLYFAAATFTPTLVRDTQLLPRLLIDAALFATLCILNCLFIHAWEDYLYGTHPQLTSAAAILCVVGIAMLTISTPAIPAACAMASAGLLAIHRLRFHLSRTHLRAAADLALLTPALVLPFLR